MIDDCSTIVFDIRIDMPIAAMIKALILCTNILLINGLVIIAEEGSGIRIQIRGCDSNRSLDAKTETDIERLWA